MAKICDYPFHLGITATGPAESGTIKSAIGIGTLLQEGIGDTIRVSLTASPQEEVRVAKEILQASGLRNFGPEIIACPTCGRAQVDVIKIATEINRKLNTLRTTEYGRRNTKTRPLKVAIMGCEVNGPGEARAADLGIAGGKTKAVLFKKGKIIAKLKAQEISKVLVNEINALYRR
jgi:(E)-4-hydroxy-3-methylbut-2-enyl-diphosphate synthase